MFENLKKILKTSWQEGTQIGRGNILTAVFLGGGAHVSLYFIYKYWFGLYENIYLRAITSFLCITVGFYDRLSPKIRKYFFPFYWHAMLIMALPFVITVNLFKTNFHEAWLYWDIFVMFLLALYVPNWLIYIIDAIIGFGGAFFFYYCTSSLSDLNPHFNIFAYLIVFIFSGFAGMCFIYGNRFAWLEKQKRQYVELISLAGSIVHEIRNPLNSVSLISSNLKDITKSLEDVSKKEKLMLMADSILDSVRHGNEIINIVLNDLQNKPINPKDCSYLKPSKFIPDITKKYGYNSESDRLRVRLNLPVDDSNDFVFKAVPERLTFIVYNLLKNSLYYLSQFPDLMITIGTETRVFGKEGKIYNVIYIHDNGPGIPSESLGKLFGDFYTSGKVGGTGLGLAFCRRNMRAFGGEIICESEFGHGDSGWTKFSLLFPNISDEEVKNAEVESRKKKILVVDDQKANLLAVKAKIEKNLPYISCDIAVGGREGVNLARLNKYSLILLDIQMPQVSGIDAAKKIRVTDKETPIIAVTSLDYESFERELVNAEAREFFNYFISKSVPDNILFRNVSKWIFDLEDRLLYLGNKENYITLLNGKEVILADDQDLNRMVTKNKLKSTGMKIVEVKDGKELVEMYKNSLNEKGESKFDLILTDINMPPFNGDKAAQEIREIEVRNKIPHQRRVPIIALSGDGYESAIRHFFSCQMTDYFIKGYDPESLIKIIANCFAEKNEELEDSVFHDVSHNIELNGGDSLNSEETGKQKIKILNDDKLSSFDEEDRKEILQTFVRDSETIVTKIKELKENDNIKDLSFSVHSIKGMSSNIGADKLYEFIKEIEIDLKAGRFPKNEKWWDNFKIYYQELNHEIKENKL